MEYSAVSIVALVLGVFAAICMLIGCLIRRCCCPFWLSEKLGMFRERMYHPEIHNYSKSPSLFSCNMNRSNPPHINIPIVIVSDENGKRVMAGKETTCVYEKQDLEEIL